MNTFLLRSLRLSVVGVAMLSAHAAFGQRFVGINDLGAGHALHVNELGDVVGYMPGNPELGNVNQAAISRDGGAFQPIGGLNGFESIAKCSIPGGPSGTRIVVGDFAFGGEQGFLTIVDSENTPAAILILGGASFAPDIINQGSKLGFHYASPLWEGADPDTNVGGSFTGRTHAFSVVQAAKEVVTGQDEQGNPIVSDIYFVVGEYEWARTVETEAPVWHAALWRVVIPIDSYSNFPSGSDVLMFDLHSAIVGTDTIVRTFDEGTSCATSIVKYSEKGRGQVTNWCAISGSQKTTMSGSDTAVFWKMSADEMPDVYQVNTAQTLWSGGMSQSLLYRRDKDSASKPFIGFFAGALNGNAAVKALDGTVAEFGAGMFASVGLDGIDRGNAWAVGQVGGVAKLYQFDGGSLTTLKSLLPSSVTTWGSLTEANSMCGRTIVGTGKVGEDDHAFRLILRK